MEETLQSLSSIHSHRANHIHRLSNERPAVGHGLVQKGRLDIYYTDKDGEGWKARKKVCDQTVCLYNEQPRKLSKARDLNFIQLKLNLDSSSLVGGGGHFFCIMPEFFHQ